ncbi:MAG: alpha/beta hydrolase [Acidobacteria bacterium]|nr:alpha/beta hydrolase [Acidobacteriota bacterium]
MPQLMRVTGLVVGVTLGCTALAGGWPASASQTTDRTRAFSVRVTGTGNQPMILIPGLLSSGDVWDSVVEHFSPRYRLHVLTIAGFADVTAVEGPLLPRVRDELIAYMRKENLDRPVLVGHSLGAFVALWVASVVPNAVGPIVAVDGVPFMPALMNPSATVAGVKTQAEQMRALYRSMTPEQLGVQTRMMLPHMISDQANIARAADWAAHSDARAAGQAMYELMTTDLREEVANIRSDVLLVAAAKAVASTPDRLEAAQKAYEAQVARVPNHRVVTATQALHFVMLDDAQHLHSTMDAFLGRTRPARQER